MLVLFLKWGTQNAEIGVLEVPEFKRFSNNQPLRVVLFRKFFNVKITPVKFSNLDRFVNAHLTL